MKATYYIYAFIGTWVQGKNNSKYEHLTLITWSKQVPTLHKLHLAKALLQRLQLHSYSCKSICFANICANTPPDRIMQYGFVKARETKTKDFAEAKTWYVCALRSIDSIFTGRENLPEPFNTFSDYPAIVLRIFIPSFIRGCFSFSVAFCATSHLQGTMKIE